MREGQQTAATYDSMGRRYAAESSTSTWNVCYERPATRILMGEVSGKRVLDAGCGPGILTETLVGAGAVVTGFDVSGEMTRLARERLGERAQILQADLHDPLAFVGSGSVDILVASLVLHYLEDWTLVMREFRRVLAPNGKIIFSTHHPAWDWQIHSRDNYFAVKRITETWMVDNAPFEVNYWRRPLTAMVQPIIAAGLVIDSLVEPDPTGEMATIDHARNHLLRTAPRFLFFRLIAR